MRVINLSTPITKLTINPLDWIETAGEKTFDSQHTCYLRVLKHRRDGTAIVYALHKPGGGPEKTGAEFVDAGSDLVAAVQRVATHCRIPQPITTKVLGQL